MSIQWRDVTPCLHLCVYYHIVPISSHSHGSAPPHFCHKNPQQTQGVFLNLDLKPKSSLCSTLWLAFLPQTNNFAKGQQQKDSAKLETKGIIKSHPSHSLDQICTKLRIHLTAFLLVFPWHCIWFPISMWDHYKQPCEVEKNSKANDRVVGWVGGVPLYLQHNVWGQKAQDSWCSSKWVHASRVHHALCCISCI
jgi:hypothetical protein